MPKIKTYLLTFFALIFFILSREAQAATYYVDATSGNDSWTGTAGAFTSGSTGPWKTISKVNNFSFQVGDDVYFKCGETWNIGDGANPYLSISWSGVEANRAVVGAYHLNGSNPVIGVSGNKPVFKSNMIVSGSDLAHGGTQCGQGVSCYIPSGSPYIGLVSVFSKNYVTIENIRTTHSNARGIYFAESQNGIVQNCETYHTWATGIEFNGGSPWNGLRSDNSQALNNKIEMAVYGGWFDPPTGGGPVSLGVTHSNDVLFKANTIKNAWSGENIANYFNSTGWTVEDNIIEGIPRIGVYISGNIRDVIVRRNMILGTMNSIPESNGNKSMFWYNEGSGWFQWPGYGIAIEDEAQYQSDYSCGVAPWNASISDTRCHTQNVQIYDNLIANVYYGFWSIIPDDWDSQWNGAAWVTGDSQLSDVFFFNNTIVAARKGSTVMREGSGDCINCQFKNNLSFCGGAAVCENVEISQNQGYIFSNNFWPKNSASPYSGSGDVVNQSANITKLADWISINVGDVGADDFKLQSTSLAINAGTTLGSPYNLDYFGTARPQPAQGGWDIGAHEYAASSVDHTAPGSPSGLLVR